MRREIEEIEFSTFVQPSDELRESWYLRPTESETKNVNRKLLLLILGGFLLSAVVIGVTKLEKFSHHHYEQPTKDDSTLALRLSLKFFHAQISGKLPDENNVSWRGDSCLHDGKYSGSFYQHLEGGYYDGGDAVKSNFPMSFAMTMLSWSVIEYNSKYQAVDELNHVRRLIKWGTDYFLNTFNSTSDTISEMVSQIGCRKARGGRVVPNDHYCWMRPEDIDYHRPLNLCYGDCPDLAAEMAAALASASIVFNSENKEYSATLLHGAKTMYKYAESMARKRNSQSMHWDDLIWGGAWMYYATGDITYLDRVTSRNWANRAGAFSYDPRYGVFGWDNKLFGAQLLLTRLRLFLGPPFPYEEMLSIFHNQARRVMCSYLPYFNKFKRTEGGLIQLNHGDAQPLQYAANAAFLATLYSDYLEAVDTPGWYCGPSFFSIQVLRDFSRSQIDYILGKNPLNMSYVVGYGRLFPKRVHHRGASIPKNQTVSCKGGWKWKETTKENPNIIEGAMVAGPDKHDGFHDVRTNYNYTEPTLVGNAGLVSAMVASLGVGSVDRNTMFSAIPPMFVQPPPPPEP